MRIILNIIMLLVGVLFSSAQNSYVLKKRVPLVELTDSIIKSEIFDVVVEYMERTHTMEKYQFLKMRIGPFVYPEWDWDSHGISIQHIINRTVTENNLLSISRAYIQGNCFFLIEGSYNRYFKDKSPETLVSVSLLWNQNLEIYEEPDSWIYFDFHGSGTPSGVVLFESTVSEFDRPM